MVLPDGSIRYVHSIGHPVLNEAGDLVELWNLHRHYRPLGRRSSEDSEKRYRLLFERNLAGVFRTSLEDGSWNAMKPPLIYLAMTQSKKCWRSRCQTFITPTPAPIAMRFSGNLGPKKP